MAKKVKQIRFFGYDDINNYNEIAIDKDSGDGKLLSSYIPIVQLGIQTIPGVRFKINGVGPAYIGHSGIFELNLEDKMEITSLTFMKSSLDLINANPSAYLIVDIVYDE